MPRLKERFEEKYIAIPESGCWLWTASGGRYGNFHTGRAGPKMEMAHRVSYELHFGPIPEGLEVRHKCDVGLCVNPYHLELGTHKDNMGDMLSRGRYKNGRVKFSCEDKETMRRLRRRGMTVKEIAGRFKCDRGYCSRITQGCLPKYTRKFHG